MERVNWAVVVPTLNEEHYIGHLLDSLSKQTVLPNEVVVVDANSEDRTMEKIQGWQPLLPDLRAYQIPRYTIARQRNFGVAQTISPHILFLDADVRLGGNDCLEKYEAEVRYKKPDVALAQTYPLSDSLTDKLYYELFFWQFFKLMRYVHPLATGMNMYVKVKPFLEVGGFDENVWVGEDHDLVEKMIKRGKKFSMLEDPKLFTSVRRIRKEGRVGFLWKMIKMGYFVARDGYRGIPENIDYDFGHFTCDK